MNIPEELKTQIIHGSKFLRISEELYPYFVAVEETEESVVWVPTQGRMVVLGTQNINMGYQEIVAIYLKADGNHFYMANLGGLHSQRISLRKEQEISEELREKAAQVIRETPVFDRRH